MPKISPTSLEKNAFGEPYKCQECHDMGWVLVKEPYYGYKEPVTLEYGVPCSHCNGGRANGNDTEMPDALSVASMKDFKHGIYQTNFVKEMKLFSAFCMKWDKWQAANKGLYLWSSECGSGKTFLACCLANSTKAKNHISVKYTTAAHYIDKCFRNKDGNAKDAKFPYQHCDLLILDDLGTEKQSDWNMQCLFELINYRLTNMKLMIVTSNASIDELKTSEQIRSRLFKCTLPIHFPEESVRAKIARQENQKFVREMLGS